jgi:replicative DNA helicase
MTNKQHGTRDLVGGAGIDLQAMRYGMPVYGAQDALKERLKLIKDCNMRMYDRPGMSIQKMRAICRSQKRKRGLDLIVVDYLQLMHSESGRSKQNRQLEISEISAGLKEMAKELDCVVLALAQLSRSVEERKDKKPALSDLRESGSIEQDADVVMMLLRPSYYFDDAPKDESWLILAKGRDVGLGEIKLSFDGPKTSFASCGDSLMSNNEKKRETGYKSKPQKSKGERELDEAIPD